MITPVILLEGFYEKDGHYYGPKGFETNGTLELLEYYSVVGLSETGKEKACIKCRFNVGNRIFKSDIPIDDLKPKKISSYIPANFRLLKEAKNAKDLFVIDCLNRTIFNMEPAQKIQLNQGYNETSDGLQYVIGDQIITEHNPEKYIVESEFPSKRIYEKKSIMGIANDFLSLDGSTAALFIAALVPCTNPLLKQIKSGYNLGFSTIIKGPTGTGKTTIAKILTGFYENGCNVTSLSSEKEAVFILSRFKDIVVLIDDLYKTDSDRVNASNYSKLIPILHQKNSTEAIRYKEKSVRIDSSLFVNAEYLPKNASMDFKLNAGKDDVPFIHDLMDFPLIIFFDASDIRDTDNTQYISIDSNYQIKISNEINISPDMINLMKNITPRVLADIITAGVKEVRPLLSIDENGEYYAEWNFTQQYEGSFMGLFLMCSSIDIQVRKCKHSTCEFFSCKCTT